MPDSSSNPVSSVAADGRAPGQAQDGTAADWVNQAAKRAEHRTEKPVSWLAYPATYTLVGINVVVFMLMFRYGPVPELIRQHAWGQILTAPFDVSTLIWWGGCDPFMVLHAVTFQGSMFAVQGQWWRLITATFIHVTILHIAINMWCLWNLGLFGEPLLGKPGLIAVYLITGVAGNLLSVAWLSFTRADAVGAGASGAVFGIAGILIVLLSNRGLVKPNLRWEEIRSLRSQVILFAAANLVIGIAPNAVPMFTAETLRRLHVNSALFPHIDNSAHLGGFLSGLLLGLPLFPKMIAGKRAYRARQRVTFACSVLALCLFGYAVSKFAQ